MADEETNTEEENKSETGTRSWDDPITKK